MSEFETPETAIETGQNPALDSTETPVTGVTYTLYREIERYIDTYIYIPPSARHTVTLWIFHTWLLGHSDVTPYLRILAPEKQSGKTTLMDLIASVTARSLVTMHMTAASMRRALDQDPPPTLLFDEIDPIFQKRGEDTAELRAVINGGFRRGATATVTVRAGKDWVLKSFNVFSPKVLVSIGALPDTIESRSIPIKLERMPKSEQRKRFRYRESEFLAQPLRERLANLHPELKEPDIPSQLSGRQADIWEPLLAIADWIGVGDEARKAALELHTSPDTNDSTGSSLLRHIKEIFDDPEREGISAIYSSDLVDLLIENEEWGYFKASEYRHSDGGMGLDPLKLAAMLRPFDIRPVRMRLYVENVKQARGYYKTAFENAWERYL